MWYLGAAARRETVSVLTWLPALWLASGNDETRSARRDGRSPAAAGAAGRAGTWLVPAGPDDRAAGARPSNPPSGLLGARLVDNTSAALARGGPTAERAARRRAGRSDRMRQRIRSALAGVALVALTTGGAALAEGNVYTVQPGDNL